MNPLVYKQREKVYWHIQVSAILNHEVEKTLQTSGFATKSDFVRHCVRRGLEQLSPSSEVKGK